VRTRIHLRALAGVLLVLGLGAAACGGGGESADGGGQSDGAANDELSGTINVSGSSTVEPITTRVAELFEDEAPDVIVNVDGPGTGDGFKLFCAGETDISDASRAIKDSEAADCETAGVEYVELKVAFDGITVMTNPANTAIECLSFADLYALLGAESEGVDTWSGASALAKELGSKVTFPDAKLDISGPGTESGTYDSFIEIVLDAIAEERGQDESIRTDFAGQAQDNVIIQGIEGSPSSLGWVGFAFAEENKQRIKELKVSDQPGGDCVAPTADAIADGSYPISRPLFIYVNTNRLAENPALGPFVDFYLGDVYEESVTKAFGDFGYVALPDDQLTATKDAWEAVG